MLSLCAFVMNLALLCGKKKDLPQSIAKHFTKELKGNNFQKKGAILWLTKKS